MKSKAFEANLAKLDVEIDSKYSVLQEIMSEFYGIKDEFNDFLRELSHPLKNWEFIVNAVRSYALDYFYIFKTHSKGSVGVRLFISILIEAVNSNACVDAADNLMLFMHKIIKEAGDHTEKFVPAIDYSFEQITGLKNEKFFLFVKSFYQLNRIAGSFIESDSPASYRSTNLLLIRYFKTTISYWLAREDPLIWFKNEIDNFDSDPALISIFKEISHDKLKEYQTKIDVIVKDKNIESKKTTKKLLDLPGFGDFVNSYKRIPDKLLDTQYGPHWKIIFLFHIMNIPGLFIIHEETLRDINHTLGILIDGEDSANITRLIEKTCSILKRWEFPKTALNCILNMGKEVYKTNDSVLLNYFIDMVLDLGFQVPMMHGVGEDWRVKVNPDHIENIRTWLCLIELAPEKSVKIVSCLTIHLALSGVFIRDTDLFPRDITRLLNSNIGPIYNKIKQLARLFPVYFNDIGAEGRLRDISTELDEITFRKDPLIHFLRKQSHVESNNLIINFIEAVLYFWETGDKKAVKQFVPRDIYDGIETQGLFIDKVRYIMSHIKNRGIELPRGLLTIKDSDLEQIIKDVSDQLNRKRITLIVSFYKLLNQKYSLEFIEIQNYLEQIHDFPGLNKARKAIYHHDLRAKIKGLLDFLESLKKVILSNKKYEIKEDIYKKRHVALDIPSMYGSYNEMKFNALGLMFRIESILNVLFEELVSKIDLSLITKATFFEVYKPLNLLIRALKLDGLGSFEIEGQLKLLHSSLDIKGLTFTQYIDIFKGLTRCVKNIIEDNFNNIHDSNLSMILSNLPEERLQKKFCSPNQARREYIVSEIFFRDMIALSPGLQQLDIFLTRILNTLFDQWNKIPKYRLRELLLYDNKRVVTPIEGLKKKIIFDPVNLGNKGYNLVQLSKFNFPVPPGFIVTTEAFRSRGLINSYKPAGRNFEKQVREQISFLEKKTGRTFGDPANPLLLSIRSGSTISQPGMMDTFLNVGINEKIAESIAEITGNSWFAWDNYRRFLQSYGMAFGIERDKFDAIIKDFKTKENVRFKREFTGRTMKSIALAYKDHIESSKINIIKDMFELLFLTIKLVFASWESLKAKTYRKIMGISEDWGTAATIQKMVFGNISDTSGSGVVFTRDPNKPGSSVKLWGDFTMGNQGEDIVSGLVNTIPISIAQQENEKRDTKANLETEFPYIYRNLHNFAVDLIEKKGWAHQEIEFTFESQLRRDLYILQTRDMTIRSGKQTIVFDINENRNILGEGIGVSGGAMSGRIVFSIEEIKMWREREPNSSLILVRNDTVPDDILEINAADGLLTARGGVTSHAAVAAHSLNKTCVVGCGVLICDERKKECILNRNRLKSGDYISIDGREGAVYIGKKQIKKLER